MKQIIELIHKTKLENIQMLIISDNNMILECFIGKNLYKVVLIECKNDNYEVWILPDNIPKIIDFKELERIIIAIGKQIDTKQLSQEEVKHIKEKYIAGTKIELIKMYDYINAVPTGTIGIIDYVDDIGTLHIKWENGSSLGIVVGIDEFKIIEE